MLNSQFDETPDPALEPSDDQEAAAALMLRAMIQAMKADGEVDEEEKARFLDRLGGDVDVDEAAFLRPELDRPRDVDALVAETPREMGPQVYAMSVLAIDLDSQAEWRHGRRARPCVLPADRGRCRRERNAGSRQDDGGGDDHRTVGAQGPPRDGSTARHRTCPAGE